MDFTRVKIMKKILAIGILLFFAATAARAAELTYTWKGGTGDWTNAVMWATSDEGGVGYPTAGCSAVFGDANSDVTLTTGYALTNLTISSVGTHAFRSTAPQTAYTLSVVSGGHVTMAGGGNGTLILDSVVLNNKIESLAGLKQLVIENKGKAEAASSPSTDVVLVNGGHLYGGSIYTANPDVSFGKLKLVGGPNVISFSQYTQKGISFASFEAAGGSGVPVISVADGRISFADVAGIEKVGGTATLADATSKIPVCPNFQIGANQYGHSVCTIDNGVVKAIPAATMMTTLVGATETDNVQLGADFTLEQDLTVNALIFNGANINLGGHTVTVKSGVFREGANGMYNRVISNGVVRLCRPNALGDSVNNTDVRCRVDFATDGNDDPGKGMIAHNCQGGGWDTHAVYTNFTGTFAPPPGLVFQISPKLRSPRAILEMRGGALKPADHYIKANLWGLSGTGSTDFSGKWKALLWLGEVGEDELESFNSKEGRIVVGNGGSICPGYVDYDGGRRGKFSISYAPPQGTLPKLDTLEFRPGSKLSVTVRADGSCSCADASAVATGGGSLAVALNGTLEVAEVGKIVSGTAFPVLFYREGKRTGSFAAVTSGYKMEYDVLQADGTYAVQVVKRTSGFMVRLR